MPQTAEYTKYGLDSPTWVALCSLILTGPLPMATLPNEPAFTDLVNRAYAAVIEITTRQGPTPMMAATPAGALLFCQCLNVSTVQEGIAYLQARSILHRASQQ